MDPIQAMLYKLKLGYLAELPERLDEIEQLILQLEQQGMQDAPYHELYRKVHSLKGSGGTYGVHALSAACHPFEDFLSQQQATAAQWDGQHFANVSFAYLDVLRRVMRQLQQQPDQEFDVGPLLAAVRKQESGPRYQALLVENSTVVIKLISRVLHRHKFNVTLQNDGYLALGRVLTENFDLLITAQEVRHLNGSALIAAIKLNPLPHPCHCILLSANQLQLSPALQAEHSLVKDDRLSLNLDAILQQMVTAWEAA